MGLFDCCQAQNVLKLNKLDELAEKIRSGIGEHSSAHSAVPTSTTSQHERLDRKLERSLLERDKLSMRLANEGLPHKQRMMFSLPDLLRLKFEVTVTVTEALVLRPY